MPALTPPEPSIRLTFNREKIFQLFKYSVYTLLALNIYFFGREEFLAAQVQFVDGVRVEDLIEAYASTIDTAAWVVLLLMFELETHVLDDRHFSPTVTRTLHGIRIFCYTFIVYAFYGYVVNVVFVYDVATLTGVSDLCALSTHAWSYAIDLDEYTQITAANCSTFSQDPLFLRLGDLDAVVDRSGLVDIQRLAWVDVINAGVWILIVIILEVDVRLQERGQPHGIVLSMSSVLKFVFYTILFIAAVYWGIKGDFVDFWDAFLWLLAFFFIELNVIEWRRGEEGAQTPAVKVEV